MLSMRYLPLFLFFMTTNATADCTSPSAVAGQLQWIAASSKVMWCDGTNWKDASVSTGASCAGTTSGTINYLSGDLRFCNGTNWVSMKGSISASATGVAAGTYLYNSGTNKYRYSDGTNLWDMLQGSGWVGDIYVGTPMARVEHTAEWTGTKMLVWGGAQAIEADLISYANLDPGGVYDPATNVWSDISTKGAAPISHNEHVSVWTGSKMIIWGGGFGIFGGSGTNTGGVYDPTTNTWTATSLTGAPSARFAHAAVWTGTKMIVWGGLGASNDGALYDPATDTWTSMTTTGAPAARYWHKAVWAGGKMIVWGGYNGSSTVNTGAMYDPATNTWTAMTTTGAPTARYSHTAISTGSKMIVWGGFNSSNNSLNTGGVYDPATNTWTAITTTAAPVARVYHSAVWTGSKMIIWGGGQSAFGPFYNSGAAYDPTTNTWTATSSTGAPSARQAHTAVWTGSKMMVWGGYSQDGGIYDPVSNTWTAITVDSNSAPYGGSLLNAIWTGSKMIIQKKAYDVVTNLWTQLNTTGAPAGITNHTETLADSKIVSWGGYDSVSLVRVNTGAVYNIATDTWSAMTTTGAPAARWLHSAVWTGSKVVIWGGGLTPAIM